MAVNRLGLFIPKHGSLRRLWVLSWDTPHNEGYSILESILGPCVY